MSGFRGGQFLSFLNELAYNCCKWYNPGDRSDGGTLAQKVESRGIRKGHHTEFDSLHWNVWSNVERTRTLVSGILEFKSLLHFFSL